MLLQSLVFFSALFALGNASPVAEQSSRSLSARTASANAAASCFPAVGFQMPSDVPSSLDNWWCNMDDEYAFLGFSYEISACQSADQLDKEFGDIRNTYNGRYIRLYGACDNAGYYDKVVDAAWKHGLGVHALIWFGFDGGNKWETRRHDLISTLWTNPKAKFVTRVIQFGSEPLFDSVLSAANLADQVLAAKKNLTELRIPVTISDMAAGFKQNGDAPAVFKAVDLVDAHMLPYFSTKATTGDKAWPLVQTDLDYFVKNALGKKIILSENGWPSKHYEGVEPNSPNAVSSVESEQGYYNTLDSHCSDFKTVAGGGVGWFWHIYSDDQEPGYGLYDDSGKKKFDFKPKTSC